MMCAARYIVCERARVRSVIVSMRETTEEGGETENGRRAAIIGKLKKHINTHIHTRTVTEFRLYAARSPFFRRRPALFSTDLVLTAEGCDKHGQLEMFWTQQRKL